MYKLAFHNSCGVERSVCSRETLAEIYKEIDIFLHEHGLVSYYKRTWEANGRTVVDVGSHTEFFYIDKE